MSKIKCAIIVQKGVVMKSFLILTCLLAIGCAAPRFRNRQDTSNTTKVNYPESGLVIEMHSELEQYNSEYYADLTALAVKIVKESWESQGRTIPDSAPLDHLHISLVRTANNNYYTAGFTALGSVVVVDGVPTNPISIAKSSLKSDYTFLRVMTHELQHLILASVDGMSREENNGHDHSDFWAEKIGDNSLQMEYQRRAFFETDEIDNCTRILSEQNSIYSNCSINHRTNCQQDDSFSGSFEVEWCTAGSATCSDAIDFMKGCWPMLERF